MSIKINVSGKNEFVYEVPIPENKKLKDHEKWKIRAKKINWSVESNKFSFNKDGGVKDFDNYKMLKECTLGFINPPEIGTDEKGKPILLTVEEFLSNQYPELYEMAQAYYLWVVDLLLGDRVLETKKF